MRLNEITISIMFCSLITAFAMDVHAAVDGSIDFISYVIIGWEEMGTMTRIVGVMWILVPVFSLIVSLTPTPKDDRVWSRAYKVLEKLALVFFKAKQ